MPVSLRSDVFDVCVEIFFLGSKFYSVTIPWWFENFKGTTLSLWKFIVLCCLYVYFLSLAIVIILSVPFGSCRCFGLLSDLMLHCGLKFVQSRYLRSVKSLPKANVAGADFDCVRLFWVSLEKIFPYQCVVRLSNSRFMRSNILFPEGFDVDVCTWVIPFLARNFSNCFDVS